jgi:hypothetical protein
MPRMARNNVSIAANSVSANQLAGELYEFLSRPTVVTLLAAAAAVGLRVTWLIGGVAVVNDQDVSQANRFPVVPDDVISQERGIGRMVLTFRNTTGAAIIVNWAIDIL